MQQQPPKMLLALCAALAALGASVEVTPVAKVVTLLEDLKAEVELEGTKEAKTYDQFACFCKSQTEVKSESIKKGRDSIDDLSADIERKTALKETKSTEMKERIAEGDKMEAEYRETKDRRDKEAAEYAAEAEDLAKALRGLTNAIKALEDAKPSALLAVKSELQRSPAAERWSGASALLQQIAALDPTDPTYKYHSHGILKTLQKLKTEFTDKKAELDSEWAKTKAAFDSTLQTLKAKIGANKDAIKTLELDIAGLKGEIATDRTNLVTKEALLKDDQLYLKDLTERCEIRAKDWDQRSQMRADELEALSGALAILKNNVSDIDAAVNLRAVPPPVSVLLARGAGNASGKAAGKGALPPSFLQGLSAKVRSHSLLARTEEGSSLQARQEAVATLLQEEGQRLRSTPLSLLASRLAADPFEKVKTLIQQLIERLLAESTAEATKKGFCDEELGKARKDREYRFQDSQQLSVELAGLEAKQDELEAELSELMAAVNSLTLALGQAERLRQLEKAANTQTLKDAREGLEALKEAITILKVYYKRAAKATVLAQASPVDEDTSGAGFEGAYKGKQEASKGIVGMLEVIRTDFERTIRHTEAAEKASAAAFVEFDRAARADISGKQTKIMRDDEDLAITKTTMQQKMDDLKTAMDRVDSALKVIEHLKPTCIDTGMSYADRVAKREEEIAALKRALCILDPACVGTA